MNDATKDLIFKQEKALLLPWSVGFNDRGMGAGDFAVICECDSHPVPVVIVECPTKEIAEHICNMHNESFKEIR